MSIKVNFLDNGEGIEILATGVVFGSEIIKAHEAIYDVKHIRTQRYQLIDKSQCTEYDVTAIDIATIAELDKNASLINPNIVIAVIESKYLEFSLTDAWQEYVDEFIFKTQSFVDRKLAMKWIE